MFLKMQHMLLTTSSGQEELKFLSPGICGKHGTGIFVGVISCICIDITYLKGMCISPN